MKAAGAAFSDALVAGLALSLSALPLEGSAGGLQNSPSLGDAPATLPVPTGKGWNYILLDGSSLTDECPVCGRPSITQPMRGTCQLFLIEETPLFSTYALRDISFCAGPAEGASYKIAGEGIYRVGGEVAWLQDLSLAVYVNDGRTNSLCFFTNAVRTVERPWPMIQVSVDQTNGTLLQQYHLEIMAAPVREIWFSTMHDFHAGIWQAPTNFVSGGDLLSSAGRVVRRNQDLARGLGIMPVVPDLGLDAVDILPGGEIAFSIEEDIFSETLGMLHEGDVISDRGRVLYRYQDLISAFVPEPPAQDQGLDAVQTLIAGEICFSIENDFFSERLGRTVRRGDLLSSQGEVIRSNEQLIARFHPAFPQEDYGLDAIHVWPSGEVWFSTETGFYGQHFEFYAPGDLLSDQGYVVCPNLALLSAFAPLEDLADFGLDGLFVISDTAPPPPSPACFTGIELRPAGGDMVLRWEGTGRVYQLERADNVEGPYMPVEPLSLESTVTDHEVLRDKPRAFYRLRQF